MCSHPSFSVLRTYIPGYPYFWQTRYKHIFFKCFETDTKSLEYKHTLSAQRRLMKTNTTFYNGVGGRTTGLQTLSQHHSSLTRNTWYKTTSTVEHWVQPWPKPGEVRKCCGMPTPSNKHCDA